MPLHCDYRHSEGFDGGIWREGADHKAGDYISTPSLMPVKLITALNRALILRYEVKEETESSIIAELISDFGIILILLWRTSAFIHCHYSIYIACCMEHFPF